MDVIYTLHSTTGDNIKPPTTRRIPNKSECLDYFFQKPSSSSVYYIYNNNTKKWPPFSCVDKLQLLGRAAKST